MGEQKRREERKSPIEIVADQVSRELANKGKLIEGGWAAYCLMFVPKDAPPDAVAFLRTAYMAGAQHLWASVFGVLDPDAEPTAGDMERMSKVEAELAAWAAEAVRDHYPTRGNA